MSLSEGSSCSFHILFAFGGGRRVNDVSEEEGRNRALVYIYTPIQFIIIILKLFFVSRCIFLLFNCLLYNACC